MPRTSTQNDIMKKQRKKAICRAALRLFSKREFSQITVDDITKAAHCSHGLFYHYFKNQEDVFLSIEDFLMKQDNKKYWIDFSQLEKEGDINRFFVCLEEISKGNENIIQYYMSLAVNGFDLSKVPSRYYKKEDNNLLNNLIEKSMKQGTIKEGNAEEVSRLFFLIVSRDLENHKQSKSIPFSLNTLKRIF